MPKRRPRQTNTKPKLVKDGFRIDKIVDKIDLSETEHKQMLYRVRWPNTWEPEENVTEFSAKENEEADDEVPTPTELTDDNEVLWKVHKILDTHVHKGKKTYHIQWKDTWVWANKLNRPDLVHNYEDKIKCGPMWEDASERPPKAKRRRLSDTGNNNTVRIVETEPKMSMVKFERSKEMEPFANEPLQVILEDKEIERILDFGVYFNERVFLVQRLNGERGLVPTKLANIVYPDAVMNFYELTLLPQLDKIPN